MTATQDSVILIVHQRLTYPYITNQFSYPHVLDKPGMILETYCVLKPGGRFVMTNIDP
jgi:ubiquinone/menaquinone biosynthesis C-methylase UbiE